MNLRKLDMKDAEFMLEWMHDIDVTKDMKASFANMRIEDCISFIQKSWQVEDDLHLAIVNEHDEYMGTVSLKNIDYKKKCAEFAIIIRSCAMGKGYSSYGMRKIFEVAFSDLQLDFVYWYVNDRNTRAIKFYEKMGYCFLSIKEKIDVIKYLDIVDDSSYKWYIVKR